MVRERRRGQDDNEMLETGGVIKNEWSKWNPSPWPPTTKDLCKLATSIPENKELMDG